MRALKKCLQLLQNTNVIILGSIFVNLFVGLDKFFFVKMSETGFYSLPTGNLHWVVFIGI